MPLKFWIRRIGDVLHPVGPCDKAAMAEMLEGLTIEAKVAIPRSHDHHRFFFAAIAEAYANWPEGHEFNPQSSEHLRAWLLCKAGYRDTTTHHLEDVKLADTMCEVINKSLDHCESYGFAVFSNSTVYVLKPKSIAWAKLDQKQFNEISNEVSLVLLNETKLSLDDYKKEAGQAA